MAIAARLREDHVLMHDHQSARRRNTSDRNTKREQRFYLWDGFVS
jgi:hypothetical protein